LSINAWISIDLCLLPWRGLYKRRRIYKMTEVPVNENQSDSIVENSSTEAVANDESSSATENESALENKKSESISVAAKYARSNNQEVLEATPISIESLLEAGAHFGHQSYRWDPKMLPYLFGEKNGIHIINLDLTMEAWKRAEKFLEDTANRGGSILFVGTKPQAREVVIETAEKCGGFSVTQRWLGGTLSNFETIKRSISRMRKIEELLEKLAQPDNTIRLNKKERLGLTRELAKLEANLGGIRTMRHVPDVIFVVDVKREMIAIKEARKLQIPVVALVDSNVDPSVVDFPIPSNDDATKAIKLFVENVAAAVSRGRAAYLSRGPELTERRGRNGDGENIKVSQRGSGRNSGGRNAGGRGSRSSGNSTGKPAGDATTKTSAKPEASAEQQDAKLEKTDGSVVAV
jgi:small subunit ribosomal protein S2